MFKKAAVLFCFVIVVAGCNQTSEEPTAELKQEKPYEYIFWGLLGSYPGDMSVNPYHLTRDDKSMDVGAILYSIRCDFKSLEEIAEESGVALEDVKRKMVELEGCELVRPKDGRYIVDFPFWDKPLRDKITSLGMELADEVSAAVVKALPELISVFESSTLPAQDYAWDDVSRIIVGGLLLDTGLNDRGLRKWKVFDLGKHKPIRPGGYRYWYKAVEDGWGKFWKFGHNQSYDKKRDLGIGLFFGYLIGGKKLDLSKTWSWNTDERREITYSVIFPLIKNGSMEKSELLKASGFQEAKLESALNELAEYQLIRIEGSTVHCNIPVFNEKDISTLLKKVDEICDDIIENVYLDYLPRIQEAWEQVKPENWDIENVDKFFMREVYDRPYNLTLDKLIRDGVLPPSPVEPPFDFWGLNGKFDVV